ncbi:MAG: hypothetical protein KGJ07_09450, partial [Patescibacteria group bacterium]|nr:hypothetical protein [Patescibacteria group bacterium]
PLEPQQLYDLLYGYFRDETQAKERLVSTFYGRPNIISDGSVDIPSFVLQDPYTRQILGNIVRRIARERSHASHYEIFREFDGWTENLTITRQTPTGNKGITVHFELLRDRSSLPNKIRIFTGSKPTNSIQGETETAGGNIISLATFAADRRARKS